VKLNTRHQRWIYAILAAAYVTGVGWIVLHYGIVGQQALDNAWDMAQAWMLRAHGAAAMLTLVAAGSVLAIHVPSGWKLRQNVSSGIFMLTLLGLLTLTGWLLYYAAGESLRAWSSWLHMAVGVAAPLVLVWHLAHEKRRARGTRRKPKWDLAVRAEPQAENVMPLHQPSTTSAGRARARR
jgi:hypothetical protein